MLLKVIHNVIRSTLSLPVYTCRCILVYLSRNCWRCDDIIKKTMRKLRTSVQEFVHGILLIQTLNSF